MAKYIKSPSVIGAAGKKRKIIKEYFGNVNTKTPEVSIAHMNSPEGWEEPGQCPEFNEYTFVLKGALKIITKTEEFKISEGQGIMTLRGEWVRYSTPYAGGAEYVAVCLPAFTPEIVNRDPEE